MATEKFTNIDDAIVTDDSTTEMSTETSTGLDQNVAGALSYLLGFVTGIAFFLLEKENEYVRFHAAQSMLLSAGIVVLSVMTTVLTTLLFVGDAFVTGGAIAVLASLVVSLFWLVFSVVIFAAWLYLMVRAYQGKRVHLPVIGKYAERMA